MLNPPLPTLFLFVAAATFLLVSSITPTPQINALRSFSNSQPQKDPCNTASKAWQGITCSSIPTTCQTTTCNIVEIDLALYGLEGVIPSDLYTLSSLRSLKLDRNGLNGILHSSIGSLSQLQDFSIDNNQISGTIPSSLGSLSQLESFYISSNQISGTIPSSIGSLSQLQDFSIDNNQISGTIPSSLGSLSQLESFYISSNQISGTIPSTIGSLSQLQDFYINNNEISGTIPSSLGSLSQLQDFHINNNQISGTIPSSIGSLSQLQGFHIFNNEISGTIPSSIGSLSQLLYFYINNNEISGTIPSSIGSLSQLLYFYIYNNEISGTIPSSIGSLSQVQYFIIYQNEISGTIPSSIGSFSQLQYFYIYNNEISGTIPSSIGSLSQLLYFYINNNEISGTIPSSIGSLSQLLYFIIYNNEISGTIPSSIGSLSLLQHFFINDNHISGTIPSIIGSLSQLQYFHIYNNEISGTIPLTFNSLLALRVFSANSNHLSGTISLKLALLSNLQQLFLQQNRLTGSLDGFLLDYDPSATNSDLVNLDVSGNQLSGTIPAALFLISSLYSIALSVNCFEGELPGSICDAVNVSVLSLDGLGASSYCKKQFIIPLTSVSVGVMMKGSIPDCVWKLSTLETLHLAGNGLRGRIGGESSINANRNFNADSDGSSSSPIMLQLVDLTLSHNYLSGEIPHWLLEKKDMRFVDLSHNKLTGTLDGLISKHDGDGNGNADESSNLTRVLKLGVNRLSGRLPPSMSEYSTLDILSGNLFSCNSIPQNDENSQYYVCGSSEYNQSMIVLGGLIGMLVLLIVFYLFIVLMVLIVSDLQSDHDISSLSQSPSISSARRWCENKKLFFHQMMKYLRYYNHQHHLISWVRTHSKDGNGTCMLLLINGFGKSLVGAEKVFLITTITIIVFSVPMYVLKDVGGQSHVTHYHQYQWYFTMAYLSGSVSGLLVMMLCLISLLFFNSALWYQSRLFAMDVGAHTAKSSICKTRELEGNEVINIDSLCPSTTSPILQESHLPPCSPQESSLDTNGARPSTITQLQPLSVRDKLYFCLIFFVNIVMIGTVNGLYIWSTTQQLSSFSRLVIQLSVSLFGMMWEAFLRSAFPKQLNQRSDSVVWLLSLVGMINGVVIPCVVTSLTSPSCYQRLIIEPDDISSSYTYSYCSLLYVGIVDVRCVEYTSARNIVPQLIPPFTYSYQCGSTLLTAYIPVKIYSSIFSIIGNMMKVVLVFQTKVEDYPIFLRESAFLPHWQVNPTRVLVSVVNNMVLLLSFGLSSPVLCFGICLSLIVSVSGYLIRLGRLMLSDQGSNIIRSSSRGGSRNKMEDNEAIVEIKIMNHKDIEGHDASSKDGSSSHAGRHNFDLNVNGHNGHEAAVGEELMKQLFVDMQINIEAGLRCLDKCKWLIMGLSCLFMTLLSWDIAGDEVGWEGSYWIPLMGVGIMATLWLLDYCLKVFSKSKSQS